MKKLNIMRRVFGSKGSKKSEGFSGRGLLVFLLVAFCLAAAPGAARAGEKDPCDPNYEGGLDRWFKRSSEQYTAKAVTETMKSMTDSAADAAKSGVKNLRGKIGDAYCIQVMYDFMNIARLVTEWQSIVGAAIEAVVNQIVNQIMSWICQNVAAAIDWASTLICLPLPDLSFSFDLPTLSRKSCNGLSLQTFMQVTPGNPVNYPVKGPTDIYGMARAIPTQKGQYRFP